MKIAAILLMTGVAAGQATPKIDAFQVNNNEAVSIYQFPQSTQTLQFMGKNGSVYFTLKATGMDFADPSKTTFSFNQKESGRIDRLSDEEYARLQKLRQAVADAEKEIAKAHDVDTDGDTDPCREDRKTDPHVTMCAVIPEWKPRYPDSYEFRGQFLLVNVPKQSGGKP